MEKATYEIHQLQLMAVICEEICKQQGTHCVPAEHEMMNACLEASKLVANALRGKEFTPIVNVRAGGEG
jgi:hypothetical protein